MEQASGDVQLLSLVQELVLEVKELKQRVAELQAADRLNDIEERLFDLGTEVRLQARRSSMAASTQLQLPLCLLSASHGGSAAASPRVAGPVSASSTPRSHLGVIPESSRSAAAAAARVHSSTTGSRPEAANGSNAGGTSVPAVRIEGTSSDGRNSSTGSKTRSTKSNTGAAVEAPAPAAPPGQNLGIFQTVKSWGEGVLDNSDELKKAAQLVAASSAAAAEAQAAAARCQQQVLEMRGRQGQAERRLDTLWQLQEAASQTQAAVTRVQQDLQQNQTQLQQQQQNMVAMRAQIQQLDARCDTCNAANSRLQNLQADLQQQINSLTKDVLDNRDQITLLKQYLESTKAGVGSQMQKLQQELQQQLDMQQQELVDCAEVAGSAVDKCEQLRQGAVVMSGRLDGVPGIIQAVVQPLKDRLDEMDSTVQSCSAVASHMTDAVQQTQLNTALGQLSSTCSRQVHDVATQLAGLTNRLEVLEGEAARKEQVVLQDEFKHQLVQLHSGVEVALLQATAPLKKQIDTKAEISQLHGSNNKLEAKLHGHEQNLLLGLRSVSDKTAVLLEHKADAAAFESWKQQMGEDLAALKIQLQGFCTHKVHLQAGCSAAVQQSVGTAAKESCSDADKAEQKTLDTFADVVSSTNDVAAVSSAADGAVLTNKAEAAASGGSLGDATLLKTHPDGAGTTADAGTGAGSGAPTELPMVPAPAPAPAVATANQQQHQQMLPSITSAARSCSAIAQPAVKPESHVAAVSARPGSCIVDNNAISAAAAGVRTLPGGKTVNCSPSSGKQRPNSIRPWSNSPSPSFGELHSAAQNAKLAKAVKDKEASLNKALHSKGVVAALLQPPPLRGLDDASASLQQQLNVLGLSANDCVQSGAAAAAAPTAAGTAKFIDGSGRLVASAGCTHPAGLVVTNALHAPEAGKNKPAGVLLVSATAASTRRQNSNKGNCGMSSLLNMSSLGSMRASTGSTGAEVQQMQEQQDVLAVQHESPTAEELRSLLRSVSAGSNRVMSQLGQAGGRIGSAANNST